MDIVQESWFMNWQSKLVQTRPNSFKLVQICANTPTFMNFNEIFINMLPFRHHFFATMSNQLTLNCETKGGRKSLSIGAPWRSGAERRARRARSGAERSQGAPIL